MDRWIADNLLMLVSWQKKKKCILPNKTIFRAFRVRGTLHSRRGRKVSKLFEPREKFQGRRHENFSPSITPLSVIKKKHIKPM